ncbi:MAG: usg protein [Alphaproteobacteria bacterium]|nr:usg protein [Alphaproteobacteria bacterium]
MAQNAARSEVDNEFLQQLGGYSITTAEILYRMPDHPSFLQTYIWQDYDLHPKFPKLTAFLDFWAANLEGPLHKITVAHSHLIKPREIKAIDAQIKLGPGLH